MEVQQVSRDANAKVVAAGPVVVSGKEGHAPLVVTVTAPVITLLSISMKHRKPKNNM